MNKGNYVFSQVISFLPSRKFDRCVAKYEGNKYVKHFSCWHQLLCMMFGQLSGRQSLRDLMTCVHAHTSKYYHLGFGRSVSLSNLAYANEHRDWRIYAEFAQVLIAEARRQCSEDSEFTMDINGNVYAFDSTTIDLCLNVFCWASFRKTKAAIKLHTLFDVRTSIPTYVLVTPALLHDVNALDHLTYEADAYYVLDRAYLDCRRLFRMHEHKSFFVTRAKHNTRFRYLASAHVNRSAGVVSDQHVRFLSPYPSKRYPETLRRIQFRDTVEQKTFVFLTNNFALTAEQIAMLYKYRWSIELFFKWIKQHLKIEAFWGTSENAVKTQVYIAIVTFVLVSIIKSKLDINRSTYEILQIIGISLLDKMPLNALLKHNDVQSTLEESQLLMKFA